MSNDTSPIEGILLATSLPDGDSARVAGIGPGVVAQVLAEVACRAARFEGPAGALVARRNGVRRGTARPPALKLHHPSRARAATRQPRHGSRSRTSAEMPHR